MKGESLENLATLMMDQENDDDIYETFFRLSEALDYFRNNLEKNLYVFSWEIGIGGTRKFMVTSLRKFWTFYPGLDQHQRHYYEVVPEGRFCKLHIDLEFMLELNEDKNGHNMTKYLVIKINDLLLAEYGVTNSDQDVMILESSNSDKFSIHLVFLKIVMENNEACGHFINHLISSLDEDDKKVFTVKNSKFEDVWFLDTVIYSRNRNFRLYKSTKLGKSSPLLISPLDLSFKAMVSANLCQFSLFKCSIVTNVPDDFNLIKCLGDEGKAEDTTRQVSNVSNFQFPSPFCEIDKFLSTKIKPGRLLSWNYDIQHKSYIFNTKDYRYCENVQRQHSSNNVYFVLFTDIGVIKQGCYKCSQFFSEPVDIKHLIPWFYDSWESFE